MSETTQDGDLAALERMIEALRKAAPGDAIAYGEDDYAQIRRALRNRQRVPDEIRRLPNELNEAADTLMDQLPGDPRTQEQAHTRRYVADELLRRIARAEGQSDEP